MNNFINLDLETRLKLLDDIKEYVKDYDIDFEELTNDIKINNKIIYYEIDGSISAKISDTLNIRTLISIEIQY